MSNRHPVKTVSCATGQRSLPVATMPLLNRRPTKKPSRVPLASEVCQWRRCLFSTVAPSKPSHVPLASEVCQWRPCLFSTVAPSKPSHVPLASEVCQWRPCLFSTAALPKNHLVCHWQAKSASGDDASSQPPPYQKTISCATGKRSLPVATMPLLNRRPTKKPSHVPLASEVCQWRPCLFSTAALPKNRATGSVVVCQCRPGPKKHALPGNSESSTLVKDSNIMPKQPPRKYKTIRHYHEPGDCHELTFSCFHRMPLLTNDAWRQCLAESIDSALDDHGLLLSAFVFMPEHVHLLVWPKDPAVADVSGFLKTLKQSSSTKIKHRLMVSKSKLLERLTIRERPGESAFRFWQEGPGFDRNLDSAMAVQFLLDYIHENPVKRGLCRRAVDWRWSSARHYFPEYGLTPLSSPRWTPLPAEFLIERLK